MEKGVIVQSIGAVVDIQFPRESMPKVYDALVLADTGNSLAERGLTFEVQQQLGDGVVRTIAMGSSDGLRRGMEVTNTAHPISVPVGTATGGLALASMTKTAPGGHSSTARRCGWARSRKTVSGFRSSRAGMYRRVKASPTITG